MIAAGATGPPAAEFLRLVENVAMVPALDAFPGLVHGFGQRLPGGPPETAEVLARRFSRALASRGRLLLLRQVHGTRVRVAPWEGLPEGDAGVATRPGLFVGVKTADCLPVLIVDPQNHAAVAIHAGWRGSASGVTGVAVRALVAQGSRPDALIVALGPAIGPCCYEVGEELRQAFAAPDRSFFSEAPSGRLYLDVRGVNVRQLLGSGVHAENIHHVHECTACLPDLYHSHRREGGGHGRMISYVGWSAGS